MAAKHQRKLPPQSDGAEHPIPGVPGTLEEFCAICRIVSGLETLRYVPYGYQLRIYEFLEERSLAILKTRQLGLTLAISVYCLFKALKGQTALWISRSGDDGKEVVKRLRKAIYGIPGLRGYLANDNLTSLDFLDGSKTHPWGRFITRAPVGDSAGRSLTNVSTVVFDEGQSIPELETVYGAAMPTTEAVGSQARIILIGTPPIAKGGYYWDTLCADNPSDHSIEAMCQGIRSGELAPYQQWVDHSGWGKVLIHWRDHPKHANNSNYLAETKQRLNLTDEQLYREYNLKLPTDDEISAFPFELVQRAISGAFEEPDREGVYYLGVDPAYSDKLGRDYCAVAILRKEGQYHRLVHLYRKRGRGSMLHLNAIVRLITAYAPVGVVVEAVGGAQTWLEHLQTVNYGCSVRIEGFSTNLNNREGLLNRMLMALENEHLTFPQCPVVEDLLNMRRDPETGKIEMARSAGKGHGDAAFGVAFALAAAAYGTR